MNDEAATGQVMATQERQDVVERRGEIMASNEIGGIQVQNLVQMVEVAKLMSRSGPAVPSYLRDNPGACLAIVIQATEWRLSAFAVANKSYAVENKGEIRVAYESQLIHAIVESRAPIKGRLKVEYEGEGDNRICIVSGHFKHEVEPSVWRSETLGRRRPGLNQYGNIKGSPLWMTKPDLQQFYDTSRDWARVYCPDILMGIYSTDELEDSTPIGADRAKDVTPGPSNSLIERLGATKKPMGGFDADHIDRTLGGKPKQPESTDAGAPTSAAAAKSVESPSAEDAAAKSSARPPVADVKDAEPLSPSAGSASDPLKESAAQGDGHGGAEDKAAATESTSPQSGAAAEMPVEPTDGKDYLPYVLAMLALLESEASVRAFWKSGIKTRNSLPNLSSEDIVSAEKAKNERIAEIKL
jgi:hypothetical protein